MSAKSPPNVRRLGALRTTPDRVSRSRYDEQHSRLAVVMNRFFASHLLRLYHAFSGDLALVLVLAEIAHHNVSSKHGSGDLGPMTDVERQENWTRLVPCNPYSISVATGIPRETVRRKVATLLRRGWLRKAESGGVVIAPRVSEDFKVGFNYDVLCEFIETAEQLHRVLGTERSQTAS
jgi:CRP-like cAMP-binding protein